MRIKCWIFVWFIVVLFLLGLNAVSVCFVDPFFHYHKPHTDRFFYVLNNQRSQNDGIIRHFEYDAVITGTSMIENFKTSEMDALFGCNAIKIPYSGATYKEIDDAVKKTLSLNDSVKIVIRCIDLDDRYLITDEANYYRSDLGSTPTYLYDDNPFNDVRYFLNGDIIFGRSWEMILDGACKKKDCGITSFDDYSRWQDSYAYGANAVMTTYKLEYQSYTDSDGLSERDRNVIMDNVTKYMIDSAVTNSDVEFYYFFSPYSIADWKNRKDNNTILRRIEKERLMAELMVPYENIHLFAFDNRTDIITDLNNYKDEMHYASWINSLIMKWMSVDKYRLTESDISEYFDEMTDYYLNYDYEKIYDQEDYEEDYYAAALLNWELNDTDPKEVPVDKNRIVLNGSDFDKYGIKADCIDGYSFVSFDARCLCGGASLHVQILDNEGNPLTERAIVKDAADDSFHKYVMEIGEIEKEVNIVFDLEKNVEGKTSDNGFMIENIVLY